MSPDDEPGDVSAPQLLPDGSAPPLIPDVHLISKIGVGGQGTVYRGRQNYLDRDVAVKVLAGGVNSRFADRFRREAKLLAGLHHPFIATCYAAGVSDAGQCFIVMEFIDGPDLTQYIEEHGALPLRAALSVVRDTAQALQHGQTLNVIHRDVKSPNILLHPLESSVEDATFPYRPKLVDLGLARATGDEPVGTLVTNPGSIMGTPATMALEQIDDPDNVDFRADIYGLGCVLWHALAGTGAYDLMSPARVFQAKLSDPPPDLLQHAPDVPPSVAALVERMMDGNRELRPQSYPELIELLEAEMGSSPASAVRRKNAGTKLPWLIGGILVAVFGGLVALKSYGSGDRGADGDVVPTPVDTGDNVQEIDGLGADSNAPTTGGAEENGDAETQAAQPPEPAFELDSPLSAGAAEEVFGAWSQLDRLLDGWTREPEAGWTCYDSDLTEPMMVTDSEASATRALPAGSWSLAGEIRVGQPFGAPDNVEVHGGLQIGFEEGLSLHFECALTGSWGVAEWLLVEEQEGTWQAVSNEAMNNEEAFTKDEHVAFEIRSEGDAVVLRVAGNEWSGTLDQLGLEGPPQTMSLTASNGIVRWRSFVLTGL